MENSVIAQDIKQMKSNFWLAWVLANAIGLGFGWSIGEIFCQKFVVSHGWNAASIVGAIICEAIIWLLRGAVLLRNRSFKLLRPLDTLIWMLAELMGWIATSSPPTANSLFGVTSGTVMAMNFGTFVWLVLWFIRVPKPNSKAWAAQAIIWTFLAFGVGSTVMGIMVVGSIQIGQMLLRTFSPLIGMAATGTLMGGILGMFTGSALVRQMRWPAYE